MSDDEQAPPDAEIGWQELETDNGGSYRVKADEYDISDPVEADECAASGPPFSNVQANWTVGSEGAPPDDVQNQTATTWYKLKQAPWYSIYKWRLTINVQDTYDYSFTDKSGDSYRLNVLTLSETHYVDYDSSDPTIVSISGK
ncbi:hypothetical protein BDP55DRAFT_634213 [Colletotrichum godetiae]|uniref:Uncharacterized protein n=1 Tax=Colletotrichum godetiae TaxID=1209918 RepID=A0AAJ0AG42_9PEZI|nr:uncharacterized protein BDP55DRAFT_634213 [Colletotrichum godetiae]KAK1673271.1 hypothetical protein BDP55DRAFT_634213 [Colletotrichum godetiae]